MSSQSILEQELQGKLKSTTLIIEYRYGIAPKLSAAQGMEQPRIEVLNPCDDGDD